MHRIITDNTRGRKKPVCLAGEMNCPPEDCGGQHGYASFLQVLANPDNEHREDYIAWMGGEEFDPDYFSLDEVNALLKRKDFGLWSYW